MTTRISARIILHVKQTAISQWGAAVKYKGAFIRALGETQEDATLKLESMLEGMGIPVPTWEVNTIPSSLVTTTEVHFEENDEAVMAGPEPVCENVFLDLAPIGEPNYPSADNGYITPNTDLGKWIAIYREAERIASALQVGERQSNIISIPGVKRDDTQSRFKDTVNKYMIENSALGAFTSAPNGSNYLLIANLLGAGLHNPLGRSFRRSEGRFRDNGNRNINNNFVPAESSDVRRLDPKSGAVIEVIKIQRMTEEEMIDAIERKAHKQAFGHTDDFVSRKSRRMSEERAAKGYKTSSSSKSSEVVKATYTHGNPDQRKAAFRFGQRMSSDVKAHGGSTDDCRDAYKFGVCKTYRDMGLPPFTEWEAGLKGTVYESQLQDVLKVQVVK